MEEERHTECLEISSGIKHRIRSKSNGEKKDIRIEKESITKVNMVSNKVITKKVIWAAQSCYSSTSPLLLI
jgi:ATP-dependent protease ClpP protease subunit